MPSSSRPRIEKNGAPRAALDVTVTNTAGELQLFLGYLARIVPPGMVFAASLDDTGPTSRARNQPERVMPEDQHRTLLVDK